MIQVIKMTILLFSEYRTFCSISKAITHVFKKKSFRESEKALSNFLHLSRAKDAQFFNTIIRKLIFPLKFLLLAKIFFPVS